MDYKDWSKDKWLRRDYSVNGFAKQVAKLPDGSYPKYLGRGKFHIGNYKVEDIVWVSDYKAYKEDTGNDKVCSL